jgi:hypothetical protein
MTTHITQDQIERIYTRYGGDMVNCARAIARQAVANHIDNHTADRIADTGKPMDRAVLEQVLDTLSRLRYDNSSALAEENFHEIADAVSTLLDAPCEEEAKPNCKTYGLFGPLKLKETQ